MRKTLKTIFTLVVFAAIAGGLYYAHTVGLFTGDSEAEGQSAAPQRRGPVPVTTCTVQRRELRRTVRGIGTIQASETVEIRPEIPGILTAVHFTEGTRVKKGTVLFSIDDTQLRQQKAIREAALAAARARLKNAERNYRRMQELYEKNSVSENQRDQAETDYETAQADVQRLTAELAAIEDQLADTTIRAPFTGVTSECHVDSGDYITTGDHLLTLYRLNDIEIAFTLPERTISELEEGQAVSVQVSAYPDRTFPGTVSFIAPNVNRQTRDLLVKAKITKHDDLLKPGTFGTAVVTTAVRPDRPVISEDALVPVRGGYIVYVIKDASAHRQPVTVGSRQGIRVEIVQGLTGGETLVRSGQLRVSDGADVTVTAVEECEDS